MKIIILYFFIFSYALGVFKPYAPYFTDAVAHVLFFKDHIETVHAHNGKSHVHTEVNQLVKNDQSEKNSNLNKKLSSENDHTLLEYLPFTTCKISIEWLNLPSINRKNNFTNINLPPPKV